MRPPPRPPFASARRRLALIAAVTLVTAQVGFSQNFAVDRFVIAGGGGTSTNGSLSLSGTIAQLDGGGKSSGGAFALDSGFWSAAVWEFQSLRRTFGNNDEPVKAGCCPH